MDLRNKPARTSNTATWMPRSSVNTTMNQFDRIVITMHPVVWQTCAVVACLVSSLSCAAIVIGDFCVGILGPYTGLHPTLAEAAGSSFNDTLT